MSENVKLFRRGMDAFNRGDVDALLELLDPQVEWHSALPVALGGEASAVRGHEGVRELLPEVYGPFPDYRIEISEIRDLGDRVLGFGWLHAQGRESGIAIDSPWCALVEVRGGKVVRIRTYLDPSAALEAAGLSE